MGSHYIPVGKIKIDKDILDIVCPAAGYGETPPPPEIYCPVNGYIQEPGQPFVPPIEVPDPSEDEIIMLVQNAGFRLFRIVVNVSTGHWFFEVYDSNNNLIETSSNYTSSAAYDLSDYPDNALLIIKIKPTVGNITRFYASQNTAYAGADYPILQVKFNTPELTSLQSAFLNVKAIKDVQFIGSVEKLVTLQDAFASSGLEYWKPSANFAALTTLYIAFNNSEIRVVDFSDSLMPVLEDLYQCFANVKDGYKAILPSSLPLVWRMQQVFYKASFKQVIMPTHAPSVTNYGSFLQESNVQGEINVPESKVCTSCSSFARSASKVEKIIFNGEWPELANFDHAFSSTLKCTHLIYPEVLGSPTVTCILDTATNLMPELREIVFPSIAYTNRALYSYQQYKVRSITGFTDPLNQAAGSELPYAANLEVFNIPYAKFSRLWLGTSAPAPKLTHVDVDWANSPWDSASSPTIRIRANLDANEINRIFGLLPTVVDGQSINVVSNPGYATCDKTIAQNKGWTVL